MHRRLLLAVLLTVLAAPAAQARSGLRVVGGHEAPAGAFDAVARITFTGGSCSGTLVARRWVLTAGHCASVTGTLFGTPLYYPASSYAVVLGTTRTDGSGGTRLKVDAIRTPPGYLGTRSWDAALLHLTTDAPQVPLLVAGRDADALWAPGAPATVAGFGVTREGATTAPAAMQVADVPIVDDATCAAAYPDDRTAPTYPDVFEPVTQVCAGFPQGGVDACQGDSGGPLLARDGAGVLKVVGATSRGYGCARAGHPGIYARVAGAALREWIRATVPEAIDDHVVTGRAQPGAPSASSVATAAAPSAGVSGSAAPVPAPSSGSAGEALQASAAAASPTRGALAARGVAVTLSCSAACAARVSLHTDARTAARHGLGSRVLAVRELARGRGGRVVVHLRVPRAVARDRRAALTLRAAIAPPRGGDAIRVARRVVVR